MLHRLLNHRIAVVGLTLVILACAPPGTSSVSAAADGVDYFANNGFGNSIGTMQHPAAEHFDGVTYAVYQGPLLDPYIVAYDHATGQWTGPIKAGDSVMGKKKGRKIDNHGRPAMVVDDEGYIHVFFGGHGGAAKLGKNRLGNTNRGKQIHVVSKRPGDITDWEVLDNISPFGTYSQVVKMDNGDLYLFYRHGAHASNWVYQVSTDNGRNFAPPVSILESRPKDDDPNVFEAWYAWFTRGQGDGIIATYNYHHHLARNHQRQRHNAYYMVMDTSDRTWSNVEGEAITLPINKKTADELTLVVDTGELWTERGTTALDPDGNPQLTVEIGNKKGRNFGGPKQTRHYRWTGEAWSGGGETELPRKATGDMQVSSASDVSLLLGGKEVAWWHSSDGGENFHKGDVLLDEKKTQYSITSMIRNAHPDARVVAAGNPAQSEYNFMYLLGDKGPIRRPKGEAEQR